MFSLQICRNFSRKVLLEKPFASREEEHLIRSTLHQVSFYNDETKPGMQVYHLQELSKTTFHHHHLQSEPRYNELLDNILQKTHLLSPTQLLSTALSFQRLQINQPSSWKPLKKRFLHLIKISNEEKKNPLFTGITPNEVILFANISSPYTQFTKPQVQQIVSSHQKHKNQWSEYDITNLLSLLQKTRAVPNPRILALSHNFYTHEKNTQGIYHRNHSVDVTMAQQQRTWLKALREAAFISYRDLLAYSTSGICVLLFILGRLGWTNVPLIRRGLRVLGKRASTLGDRQVVMLSNALIRHHVVQNDVLKRLGDALANGVPKKKNPTPYSVRTISYATYMFSKLDYRHISFIQSLKPFLQAHGDSLEGLSLYLMVYGIGRLGIRDEEIWKALETQILKTTEVGGFHLSIMAHAVGKVGYESPALLKHLWSLATEQLKSFNSKQLIHFLQGMSRCNYLPPSALTSLLSHLISNSSSTISFSSNTQLQETFFHITLHHPSLLALLSSPSSSSFVASPLLSPLLSLQQRYSGQFFSEKEEKIYHESLQEILNMYQIPFHLLPRLGPHPFDLELFDASFQNERVFLELVNEADICPLSGAPLGMLRVKLRDAAVLGGDVLLLSRKKFLQEKRVAERGRMILSVLEEGGKGVMVKYVKERAETREGFDEEFGGKEMNSEAMWERVKGREEFFNEEKKRDSEKEESEGDIGFGDGVMTGEGGADWWNGMNIEEVVGKEGQMMEIGHLREEKESREGEATDDLETRPYIPKRGEKNHIPGSFEFFDSRTGKIVAIPKNHRWRTFECVNRHQTKAQTTEAT